ncbi:MAG: FAD-binding protein [Sedimentisphaerales bacterium]|nr:FAD-binding protein [Sedimentisphaerales bacterium]
MEEQLRQSFEQALRNQVRGEVHFDDVTLGLYATDASIYQIMPVAVILPRDGEDVRAAVQVAVQHKVSILPRGAGTSLNGQAVGAAIVLDFSKYMNRILELNVAERWVRVEPGIVLDELNVELARHGLTFAPDPATGNRATIGGMIGNNSSGMRSIIYGMTIDHIRECKTLLADGTVLDFRELEPQEYEQRCRGTDGNTREAEILSGFKELIESSRDEIEKRFPKVGRRVQGYNLDAFIHTERWNLSKIMVGSEGTLGITLEARLNLEPLPKSKTLCIVHFDDLMKSLQTLTPILKHTPSAVEILDGDIIVQARRNPGTSGLCGFIEGNPQAVLIVEFIGDDAEESGHKARVMAEELQKQGDGYAWPIISDSGAQGRVWLMRKNALGLMQDTQGRRKPTPCIEDTCVPIAVLPEYIDKVSKFCKSRQVPVTMYAHASVGIIHMRPLLDLKKRRDIENMKAITDYTFELTKRYGGSWSGEHGDGRVRSPYLERFFGSQIYNVLRDVKKLFDPAGLMNPGLIIDPNPMDQDLRFGPHYHTSAGETEYHYRREGSFIDAVEMCNGVGVCRQNLTATMCPSYRVTLDEKHSTRGRANSLRLAISGKLGPEALTSQAMNEVMELCLSCKGCKNECPNNVDMARLKSEFLQTWHDSHRVPLREKLIAHSPGMAALMAGWKAPIVNAVQKSFLFRFILEKFAGFDRRRCAPAYAREPLGRWFSRRPKSNSRLNQTVVLFDDTYMNYHQTGVGVSAVELLESCGYEVILAQAGCCQRPKISHGFLREAKKAGEQTLRNLDTYIQKGLKIVVCEPGCCSALTDDLPDLIDDEQLGQRIKENVMMIDEFIYREIQQAGLQVEFTSPYQKILLHGHCHQKSLYGTTAMKEILQGIPGLEVTEIDSGCCGMAGSFGYEKEHYEMSMKIGEQRLFPAIRQRESDTAVVACGFSCRHQITDGTGVMALHWVETLRGTTAGKE